MVYFDSHFSNRQGDETGSRNVSGLRGVWLVQEDVKGHFREYRNIYTQKNRKKMGVSLEHKILSSPADGATVDGARVLH